jgi:hypothetical protein
VLLSDSVHMQSVIAESVRQEAMLKCLQQPATAITTAFSSGTVSPKAATATDTM